jgi:integrase/recombinase XerD
VGRAGIIVRYLVWKAAAVATLHPFAELKQHYGGRLMTIVRALLREDYRDALERLRPLPEWGSSLGPLMREDVAHMRSLGYRYETRARDLRRFDRYLQRHPVLNAEPFPVLIEAWQSSGRTPRHRLMVQLCARALSQAMHRRDEKTPIRTIEAQIVRLFKAARSFRSRYAPLRGLVVHTVLALAYCAGLRIGEIAALRLRDIDVEHGIIEIRETKFFKTRRLPLAPRVVAALSSYLAARQATGAPTGPDAPLWWTPQRRKGYTYGQAQCMCLTY